MLLLLLFVIGSPGGDSGLSPEHARLNFLAGTWETESLYPGTGLKVKGKLTYTWVLGGSWLKFTFHGEHPERPFWEAHGMMHFDQNKGSYQSIAFFSADGPHTMTGTLIQPHTVRFESVSNGIRSGIDYTKTENAVFQENWRIEKDGRRVITLQTTYRPIS
ncbi:MAG: DUF1579 family protein [Acidobacteriota bacterium]|nr:DUF1579 family protein [Acidobacteriota bacterium]